jgi:hypothetical protein
MAVIVTGDAALIAKFQAADAALRATERDWLAEAGVIVETAIEANIAAQGLIESDGPHPGALVGSGRVFGATAHGVTVGFGQGLDYAASLENGAEPHPIDAVNAENLKFLWKKMGLQFYGPHVNHPGNRPYKFMRNGSEEAMVPLVFMFMARLRAIFGGSL